MSRIRIGNMQYTVTRAGCFYYEFGRRVYMNLFWLKLPDMTVRQLGVYSAPTYYRVHKLLEREHRWMSAVEIEKRYDLSSRQNISWSLRKLYNAGYLDRDKTENDVYYRIKQ